MKDSTETTTATESIPHLEVFTDHGMIRAPVKLVFRHGPHKPVPLLENGRYIHALPGGGELAR